MIALSYLESRSRRVSVMGEGLAASSTGDSQKRRYLLKGFSLLKHSRVLMKEPDQRIKYLLLSYHL